MASIWKKQPRGVNCQQGKKDHHDSHVFPYPLNPTDVLLTQIHPAEVDW